MKKILSFMLALVMIASMAVVAFAEGETATTPVTETIYDAADFAANDKVVATPDAAKGHTGFSELSLKFDVFQNYQNFFQLENLKKDNTVFLFYYIAQGSGELFFWYNGQFAPIPATEGYHVAQITLAEDTTHFGFHMKNGSTMELYVGSILVRQGTINFPALQLEEYNSDKYTEILGQKFTFNAADYQGYGAYGTNGPSAVVEAATVDGLVDAMGANAGTNVAKLSSSGSTILALNSASTFQFNKGYTYKITTHAYVVTPSTGNNSYIFNRLTTDWGTAPTFTTGYNKLEFVYTPSNMTDGFGFHGLNGEMYIGNVEIEVLSYNPYGFVTFDANSEYTLVPEQLVLGSQGVVTDEGLLFNDLSLGNWYGPALTSSLNHLWGKQMPLKVEFNVKTLDDGNLMWRNAHNGETVLIAATGDLGDHVWEDVANPQLLTQIHWQYANPNNPTAALYIKSVTINAGKSANHPIVTEWNPADLLAAKNAVHETIEVEYDFDAEKVYMVSVDYRLYAGSKNATVTIGDKTMTLKAGDNTVNIAVIGGADKIVVNAPAATVLVGDITYEEVGEDYAVFMGEVNDFAGELTLDKTLATTVDAIEAYLLNLINNDGTYIVTDITYVEGSFVPYAEDDATVATASAASNGTISFVIDLEETDARGFTYTDEFTFEIVKKDVISDYNAVVATGDNAIVAIVALIAVISLAGVVIAKKKVASK